MRLIALLAAVGAVLWLAVPATADGLIVVTSPEVVAIIRPPAPPPPRPPHPPHPHPIPVPRPHPVYAPLEVEYHHVSVTIRDQVAVTEVDQSFRNPSDLRLEGMYLFPIPAGGQIDKFAMDIDGRMAEAELLDAEKARRIYEDIVRRMRDPALLEYAGRDLFKVRIFPIEPRSSKRIKLRYTQLLKSDAGLVSYVYPLNTEKFSAAPIKAVSVKVDLQCRRPIKSLYSPSHTIERTRHGDTRAVVGFEVRDQRPDTDFALYFSTQRDSNSDVDLSLLTHADPASGADAGYFLLLASAPWSVPDPRVARKDVVFVLDTSGSMSGAKLDQARKALRFCVHALNDGDGFQVMRFSTEAEELFSQITAANADSRRQADAFLDGLKAIGGTAVEEALVRAVARLRARADAARPGIIVLLTDGRPTIGLTDEKDILRELKRKLGQDALRVFCFGIGNDVNTHLLDRLAEETRAVSQYVLPEEDIEVKVSSFFTRINNPVLANLKLAVSNVRVSHIYPHPLPDLFQGDQLVILGRYSGAGDAAVTLEGAVNGKARTVTFEGAFARQAADHDFLPRLWATRRVGHLLDQIRLNGESGELRDEVTQLARQYGIVTPYTAYLIMEDETRRGVPMAARTMGVTGGAPPPAAVREELRRSYEGYNMAKSGEAAVAGAQVTDSLKRADQAPGNSLPAAATAPASIQRQMAAAGPGGGQAVEVVTQSQQQTRVVRGRAFYQNGDVWVDATTPERNGLRRVQVSFGSDEYFALLRQHPEANAFLALGQNVDVRLRDTVYEIR